MKFILRFGLPVVVGLFFIITPRVASAQFVPPFGGFISFILPCANMSIYTVVLSARNIDPMVPGPYIWAPGTMTTVVPPIPGVPPTHPGQEILGTFDVPYVCYIPPHVFLFGFRMQTEGVSI